MSSQDVTEINSAIRKFTKLRIKERLQDTMDIPPLSETARQIIQLRSSPSASVEKLSSIVEMDPSLSAQIIGWASSAYYAAPGKINTVHDAIVRVLGYDLVLNIASGIAIGGSLKIENQKEYWLKAVWTATLAERLSRRATGDLDPSICYLAGLLHNFGHLVLAHVFPPHYDEIKKQIETEPDKDRIEIENEVLGVTSDQLSSSLLAEWSLPDSICTAIKHQCEPEYDGEHWETSAMLSLTVQLLRERKLYPGKLRPYENHLSRLKLDEQTVTSVLDSLVEKAEGINKIAMSMA